MKIRLEDDYGNVIHCTPEEFAAFALLLKQARAGLKSPDCLQPLCLYGRIQGPKGLEYCTCERGRALKLAEMEAARA
jgi:hypothetical protein